MIELHRRAQGFMLLGDLGGVPGAGGVALRELIDAGHGGRDPGAIGVGAVREEGVDPQVLQAVFRMAKPEGDKPRAPRADRKPGDDKAPAKRVRKAGA